MAAPHGRVVSTEGMLVFGTTKVRLLTGDITALSYDAIVTAANAGLHGGGGVDGAVHRAAGPDLLRACRAIGGCPTGEARITPGFRLKAKHVIHAVGPIWQGGGQGEPKQLAGAYIHSLRLALENGCKSIAFPAISCGVYGYPIGDACRIALDAIRAFCEARAGIDEVGIVAFDRQVADAYRALGLS